jgi:hypothetical protein
LATAKEHSKNLKYFHHRGTENTEEKHLIVKAKEKNFVN